MALYTTRGLSEAVAATVLLSVAAFGPARAEVRLTLKCDGTETRTEFDPAYKVTTSKLTRFYTLYVKSDKEALASYPAATSHGVGFDYGRWYDWSDEAWHEFPEAPDEKAYWLIEDIDTARHSYEYILSVDRRTGKWAFTTASGKTPSGYSVTTYVDGKSEKVALRTPPGPKF